MILSPYRNPPYRTPTPRSPSRSPAENTPQPPSSSSPKRKRSRSTQQDPHNRPTRNETAVSPAVVVNPEEALAPDSPRTEVADKLKDLEIRPTSVPARRTGSAQNSSPRKRPKLSDDVSGKSEQLDDGVNDRDHASIVVRPFPSRVKLDLRCATEIHETPGCRAKGSEAVLSTSPPLLTHSTINTPSHPPPTPGPGAHSPNLLPAAIPDRSISPLPLPSSLSIDRAALTWQDDEITGHEIDTTVEGDDDGEGINGIGFKPTPAIAYARQQRRRQQVNEWKAREAREARQRRLERRRVGAGSGTGDAGEGDEGEALSMGRRSVRFEGVG